MTTRLSRLCARLLLAVAVVAQGGRSLVVDCPMHAAHAARSAHTAHEAPGSEGPRVPCGCAEACQLTLAAEPPGDAWAGNARITIAADLPRMRASAAIGRASHVRLPFATAPPLG